jgi:hypothetical protein
MRFEQHPKICCNLYSCIELEKLTFGLIVDCGFRDFNHKMKGSSQKKMKKNYKRGQIWREKRKLLLHRSVLFVVLKVLHTSFNFNFLHGYIGSEYKHKVTTLIKLNNKPPFLIGNTKKITIYALELNYTH